MDTSKATARPWETHPVCTGKDGKDRLFIRMKDDWRCSWIVNMIRGNGAVPDVDASNANAALIVRAVNSHDALVAALRAAENWITEHHASMGYAADSGVDGLLSQLRAALVLAEQG